MGGTLVVSRAEKIYPLFQKHLTDMGFDNITITGAEKDGLNMLIRDIKPRITFIGCMFYKCGTPFMIADLHKNFPKLNIAAISIMDFPDDIAMNFIFNGAKSYVNFLEGEDEFYKGMEEIREGKEYIAPEVVKRIDLRSTYSKPAMKLTKRKIEILRCICNGFTGEEIANELHISVGTLYNSKSEIYAALSVRNDIEAMRAALDLGIITQEELIFYGRNYELKPKPDKKRSFNYAY